MKHMKKIYTYITVFALLVFSACTDGFEEMNENPNEPTEVSPQYLIDKYKERFGETHTSNLLLRLWSLAKGGLIKRGNRDYRSSGMFYNSKPKPKTRRKNA